MYRIHSLIVSALWFLLFCLCAPVFGQESEGKVFVTIEGVDGRVAQNVRSFLSIQSLHEQTAPGPARIRYLHSLALRDIRRAVTPFGYYQFELNADLEARGEDWYARYEITLGPAILLSTIDIRIDGDAEQDEAFQSLRNQLNLRPGSPLRHSSYELAKTQLLDLASDRGYYQAQFSQQELRIDLDHYQAHILLVLDSGPRYKFGDVQLSEGHLNEEVLYRFIPFNKGDFITSRAILDLQLGMAGTDYFSRVEIQPLWAEADTNLHVPLRIDFEPNKRKYDRIGFGYGTDSGPRISFDANRRWINRRGHRLHANAQFSEILSGVGASYIIPGERPQTDQYAIRTAYRNESTSNTQSELFTLGVSWQTELTRTQRILALDWQTERDRFDGQPRRSDFVLPSAQWIRVHADNRLDVDRGFRLTFGIRGSSRELFSDTDFVQANLSGKFITRITETTRILVRSELAFSESLDFDRVPTSLRFYAGGDHSVRGYGYRSISPRNDVGEVIGARHLMTASLETDYEFRPHWRVAAFTDAGNAFNDISEPLKFGAGIGLRWQSPIGPIRIDLAHGFSRPGDQIRLHITIGPDL